MKKIGITWPGLLTALMVLGVAIAAGFSGAEVQARREEEMFIDDLGSGSGSPSPEAILSTSMISLSGPETRMHSGFDGDTPFLLSGLFVYQDSSMRKIISQAQGTEDADSIHMQDQRFFKRMAVLADSRTLQSIIAETQPIADQKDMRASTQPSYMRFSTSTPPYQPAVAVSSPA